MRAILVGLAVAAVVAVLVYRWRRWRLSQQWPGCVIYALWWCFASRMRRGPHSQQWPGCVIYAPRRKLEAAIDAADQGLPGQEEGAGPDPRRKAP